MRITELEFDGYTHQQVREYVRFMEFIYLRQLDFFGDPFKAAILRAVYLEEWEFDRGCSATSLADSLNIPRETVRRKAAKLVERGWLKTEGSIFRLDLANLSDEQFFQKIGFDGSQGISEVSRFIDRFLRTADRIKRLTDD